MIASLPGGLLRYAGLICVGSIDVISGAARPITQMTPRINAPISTAGLRTRRRSVPARGAGAGPAGASSPIASAVAIGSDTTFHERWRHAVRERGKVVSDLVADPRIE